MVDLAGDPTVAVASGERDFRVLEWLEAGLLLIAGDSACVTVDLERGVIVGRYHLDFTGLSSIDVLDLVLQSDGQFVVVVSTRRVWLLGLGGLSFALDCRTPVRSARFEGGDLVVEAIDADDPWLGSTFFKVSDPFG